LKLKCQISPLVKYHQNQSFEREKIANVLKACITNLVKGMFVLKRKNLHLLIIVKVKKIKVIYIYFSVNNTLTLKQIVCK